MKLLIAIGLICFSISIQARVKGFETLKGDWGTGGGNAIVCFQSLQAVERVQKNEGIVPDDELNNITSIEMYDLYEAKLSRGFSHEKPEIVEIKHGESFDDYINVLSGRFKGRVKYLADLVDDGNKLIPEEHFRIDQFVLKRQNDIGNVILPSNKCLIITMAAQLSNGEYFEVYVDSRLFNHNKHSKVSQATLILHERLYGILRSKFNHHDSARTRVLVKTLLSYHVDITESKVAKMLNDLQVIDDDYFFSFYFDNGKTFKEIDKRLQPFIASNSVRYLRDNLIGLRGFYNVRGMEISEESWFLDTLKKFKEVIQLDDLIQLDEPLNFFFDYVKHHSFYKSLSDVELSQRYWKIYETIVTDSASSAWYSINELKKYPSQVRNDLENYEDEYDYPISDKYLEKVENTLEVFYKINIAGETNFVHQYNFIINTSFADDFLSNVLNFSGTYLGNDGQLYKWEKLIFNKQIPKR